MAFSGPQLGSFRILLLFLTLPLAAQQVVSARAGLITFMQGSVFVDGDHAPVKAGQFPHLKDGETLVTDRGRVELLLAPGAVLRIGENAQVRMDATRLADTRITVQKGDVLIEIWQLPNENRIQVQLGDTVTELTRLGLYRFGAAQPTLRVYGGEAVVRSGGATASAKRGMAVALEAGLPVSRFDRKQTDLFHTWAARRSFDLFMNDPDARRNQTHWQFSRVGYMGNSNFGVEFRALMRLRPAPPRFPGR